MKKHVIQVLLFGYNDSLFEMTLIRLKFVEFSLIFAGIVSNAYYSCIVLYTTLRTFIYNSCSKFKLSKIFRVDF